jgi:hypothetical protein
MQDVCDDRSVDRREIPADHSAPLPAEVGPCEEARIASIRPWIIARS